MEIEKTPTVEEIFEELASMSIEDLHILHRHIRDDVQKKMDKRYFKAKDKVPKVVKTHFNRLTYFIAVKDALLLKLEAEKQESKETGENER